MKKRENTVATVVKAYSILNCLAGICLGISIGNTYKVLVPGIGIYVAAAAIIGSLLLFCIGEALQLLEDIKNSSEETEKHTGLMARTLRERLPVDSKAKASVEETIEELANQLPEI